MHHAFAVPLPHPERAMSEDPIPVNAPPAGEGQRIAPRSTAFQRYMAAPLITASILMLATLILAILAWRGGTADGERLQIELAGTCGEAALPILVARMEEMGLGQPHASISPHGVSLVATMPGSADDEASHIPSLLARQGHLRAGAEAAPIFTHEGIELAQIRLDESGLPYIWLELSPPAITALEAKAAADPDGTMPLVLDGVEAPARPFNKPVNDGGIRLLPGEGVTRSRMRIAADQAIVLTHGPLPCALSVSSVEAVAASPNQR